jgi:hypothetical protein
MKILFALPLFCAAALGQSGGWQSLFDGKTLAGWIDPATRKPPGDAWSVEDGCIKTKRRPHITEDLVSAERYGDFELEWEWRISAGGNSGVKYRIQDFVALGKLNNQSGARKFEDQIDYVLLHGLNDRKYLAEGGQHYVVGFEYQLIDNARHPDAKRTPKATAAALYDLIAPARDVTRPVGEFNQARLVVQSNHVEHWLNGEKVIDAMLDTPEIREGIAHRWGAQSPVYKLLAGLARRECPISLQNHDDEAWFRNLRIRRLR